MDFKISNKEKRLRYINGKQSKCQEYVSDIFDIYPVFGDKLGNVVEDGNYIIDCEFLDNRKDETMDRVSFGVIKQMGLDPLDETDGVQWSEYILGDIPDAVLIHQIMEEVRKEGNNILCKIELDGEGNTIFILEYIGE